jgi:murein DD-endopeptidase MepM/ murein hydrolase activator NlpD
MTEAEPVEPQARLATGIKSAPETTATPDLKRNIIDAALLRSPSSAPDGKFADELTRSKIVLAAADFPQVSPDTPRPEFKLAAIDFYLRPPDTKTEVPAESTPAEKAIRDKTIAVGRGDTLMKVLVKAGADRRQAHGAISALTKVFNPRRLKVGQEVTLTFRSGDEGAAGAELVGVSLDAAIDREVVATRETGGDFIPRELTKEFDRRLARGSGEIKYSLYVAATRAGLPVAVIMEMIRILSWDVDFQRDIQPGDKFDVVFERDYDGDGRAVREGAVRFVSLTMSGVELAYYRYQPSDDNLVDYFDAKGRSVRKALLRTPVDGAKLTSGYGKRRHPILGYTRVHRGVDFGAPATAWWRCRVGRAISAATCASATTTRSRPPTPT